MTTNQLIDRYNRHLNYLRISITDRCNLRCTYCVPADRLRRLSHTDILRYEEILRLIKVGVGLGISKVRVTGGEPLVRKGVGDFLANLSQIHGISEVTLTTNGVLLKDNIRRIENAGIRRINISLDTLQKAKFREITGDDLFDQVWGGITAARQSGFDPIKINVVALRGVNEDEFTDFANLTRDNPFHIRFIEYMPIGKARMRFGPPLLVTEIKERLRPLGPLVPIEKDPDDGPAERFKIADTAGEIGFISALSHHFCSSCNRLRLTASGQLRPCLLSDRQLDLKGPLRNGASDEKLAEIFCRAVANKPSDHSLTTNEPSGVTCQMSSIGG
jgi:cyclic pyranopterin phosphate synthase